MIPVAINEKEMLLLKKSKEGIDWRVFTEVKDNKYSRNKLFYLFQRFVALPAGRIDKVKELSKIVKELMERDGDVVDIFAPVTVTTYSKNKDGKTEEWIEQGGKKIIVKYVERKQEDV